MARLLITVAVALICLHMIVNVECRPAKRQITCEQIRDELNNNEECKNAINDMRRVGSKSTACRGRCGSLLRAMFSCGYRSVRCYS